MKNITAAFFILTLFSCGGKKSNTASPAPEQVSLLAPAQNLACNSGTVLSASEAKVPFSWDKANNADSYEIKIKNLITGTTVSQTTSGTQTEVTLVRNAPYSWYIISKSGANPSTASSPVWKFYLAGDATFSYAPFPAEPVTPANGQALNGTNGKITLDWSGSDADNDITGYDVYLGTSSANLTVVKSNVSESLANDIAVNSATSYFWKVITKDSRGNTSDSGLFEFRVN